jgi:hypothetical protein
MGKVFDGIDETLASWITAKPVWFVATPLASDGHINVSPVGKAAYPSWARAVWAGSKTACRDSDGRRRTMGL